MNEAYEYKTSRNPIAVDTKYIAEALEFADSTLTTELYNYAVIQRLANGAYLEMTVEQVQGLLDGLGPRKVTNWQVKLVLLNRDPEGESIYDVAAKFPLLENAADVVKVANLGLLPEYKLRWALYANDGHVDEHVVDCTSLYQVQCHIQRATGVELEPIDPEWDQRIYTDD